MDSPSSNASSLRLRLLLLIVSSHDIVITGIKDRSGIGFGGGTGNDYSKVVKPKTMKTFMAEVGEASYCKRR